MNNRFASHCAVTSLCRMRVCRDHGPKFQSLMASINASTKPDTQVRCVQQRCACWFPSLASWLTASESLISVSVAVFTAIVLRLCPAVTAVRCLSNEPHCAFPPAVSVICSFTGIILKYSSYKVACQWLASGTAPAAASWPVRCSPSGLKLLCRLPVAI